VPIALREILLIRVKSDFSRVVRNFHDLREPLRRSRDARGFDSIRFLAALCAEAFSSVPAPAPPVFDAHTMNLASGTLAKIAQCPPLD
jgi:hypothetical protein